MVSSNGSSNSFLRAFWKSLAGLLKVIVAGAALISAYFYLDSIRERRISIDIIPMKVELDSILVFNSYFEVDADELQVISDVDNIDVDDYFESQLGPVRAMALMQGGPNLYGRFSLKSFDVALTKLRIAQAMDSMLVRNREAPLARTDFLNLKLHRRADLISKVEEYRGDHLLEVQDSEMISVEIAVGNRSSTHTSILEPALLRVRFEGSETEVKLRATGSESQMTLFGVDFSVGNAKRTLRANTVETIRFSTYTREDLGDEWSILSSALAQSGADAQIVFQTLDGSIHASDWFAFSSQFADKQSEKMFDRLKQE